MSQYLGRNKNKSRSRYIAKTLEENKKKEGMREVFDIVKDIKRQEIGYKDGKLYDSTNEKFIEQKDGEGIIESIEKYNKENNN